MSFQLFCEIKCDIFEKKSINNHFKQPCILQSAKKDGKHPVVIVCDNGPTEEQSQDTCSKTMARSQSRLHMFSVLLCR